MTLGSARNRACNRRDYDTLNNTTEQRYLYTMASDEPEDGHVRDENLSRLVGIAENVVDLLTRLQTDWCQIARDARELADQAEQECRCLSNDLTRE